jgi:hypothetical protein
MQCRSQHTSSEVLQAARGAKLGYEVAERLKVAHRRPLVTERTILQCQAQDVRQDADEL